MITWTTLPFSRPCGLCGVLIPAGTRLQTVQIAGVTRPLVRCATCAHDAPTEETAG